MKGYNLDLHFKINGEQFVATNRTICKENIRKR